MGFHCGDREFALRIVITIDAVEGGESTVNRIKRNLTYFNTFRLKVLYRNIYIGIMQYYVLLN